MKYNIKTNEQFAINKGNETIDVWDILKKLKPLIPHVDCLVLSCTPYEEQYFTIEALETGNVYFKYISDASTEDQRYMEYSKDNGHTWTRTTNVDNEEVIMTISLIEGETAIIRGDNDTLTFFDENSGENFNSYFYSDIEFNVYGNVMSLIHGDAFVDETTVTGKMFNGLFYDKLDNYYGNVTIDSCYVVEASNLILPATTLANACYAYMFNGCTSLTTAPKLNATTLANDCYAYMFNGCTSLTTAPELNATTLVEGCYANMFSGCTSLTTAPELNATTLANYCYSYMFNGCTSLTTAPELNATTLVEGCYECMFNGCTNLNYIKAMFTTTPSTTYTQSWVYNVAASGTFVKNSSAVWSETSDNGIPSGWTVETANA